MKEKETTVSAMLGMQQKPYVQALQITSVTDICDNLESLQVICSVVNHARLAVGCCGDILLKVPNTFNEGDFAALDAMIEYVIKSLLLSHELLNCTRDILSVLNVEFICLIRIKIT